MQKDSAHLPVRYLEYRFGSQAPDGPRLRRFSCAAPVQTKVSDSTAC